MENEKLPLGMVVVDMLKSMFRVIESRAYEHTGMKLTMPQFALLHTISKESDEVILKDVAEKMGKDKSAIVRMVDQLEKKRTAQKGGGSERPSQEFTLYNKKRRTLYCRFFRNRDATESGTTNRSFGG